MMLFTGFQKLSKDWIDKLRKINRHETKVFLSNIYIHETDRVSNDLKSVFFWCLWLFSSILFNIGVRWSSKRIMLLRNGPKIMSECTERLGKIQWIFKSQTKLTEKTIKIKLKWLLASLNTIYNLFNFQMALLYH